MRKETELIYAKLLERYGTLSPSGESILQAFELLRKCYASGNKILVGGNGGSASDSEHIVGELMKGFMKKRPLGSADRDALRAVSPEAGLIGEKLQGALPAFALTGSPALSSAFGNDVDPELALAQQVYGLGRPEDVLVAISTSGNAKNLAAAARVARAFGLRVLALTGEGGGLLASLADVTVRVPERETYRVQELHLPVYHALCAMLEAEFFPGL